jgi:hypothetical protein
VSELRLVLGSDIVADSGDPGGALEVECWAVGRSSPSETGIARLRVASYAVSLLRRGGASAERIAAWFTAPNRSLGDRSPAVFVVDEEDPYASDLILTAAARRFLRGR